MTTPNELVPEGEAWKFLTPYGTTTRDGVETIYPLPGPGEEWGPWLVHPDPHEPDGNDCGPGRYHLMRQLHARYAPRNWWPWRAQYAGIVGSSDEKIGVRAVRLGRITRNEFVEIVKSGDCADAVLRRADLSGADLRGAVLRGADLRRADLSDAVLSDADLRRADLRRADLRGAVLRGADLRRAYYSTCTIWGEGVSAPDGMVKL